MVRWIREKREGTSQLEPVRAWLYRLGVTALTAGTSVDNFEPIVGPSVDRAEVGI